MTTPSSPDTIAEVIAHLDEFERDLARMTSKVREYRYMLFAHVQAEDAFRPKPSPCEHGRRFCLDCHGNDVLD